MKPINTIINSILALIFISVSVSCANRSFTNYHVPAQKQQESMRAVSDKEQVVPEYRLGFGDVIEVKFFNNEQFNEEVTVRPDGRISLERVGEIQVSGITPAELDEIITKAYSEIIVNPDVTVIVRQFSGYQVYVLGEVNSPGGYPIQQNMTVLQSIATAGGIKNTAKLSSVMVLRRQANGELGALKIDLSRQIKGKLSHNEPNQYVQPQDLVYVPKTFISSVSIFLNQVYDGLIPPVDAYVRVLFWMDRRQ